MPTIKFSHQYEKMPPDFQCSRLVALSHIYLEEIDPEFLKKDTAIVGGGHYPLPPKGKYMVLWLESTVMNIRWQTIRRYTPMKYQYYYDKVGQTFDCVITKLREHDPFPEKEEK